MSEQTMRQNVIKALRGLDAVAVETKLEDGIPDVNYIDGWIELKWLRSWPKRPDPVVKLGHDLMPHQRAWLRRRHRRGGLAWVLLQVGREWLLFDAITADEVIGKKTRQEMVDKAHSYWQNGLNPNELKHDITKV